MNWVKQLYCTHACAYCAADYARFAEEIDRLRKERDVAIKDYKMLNDASIQTHIDLNQALAENAELLMLVETSNKLVDELKAKLKRACDALRQAYGHQGMYEELANELERE